MVRPWGVRTAVCRGGDRAWCCHRCILSSLTCGFSMPHLAISTIHCFHDAGYSCWDFSTSTQKMVAITVSQLVTNLHQTS